MCSRNFSHEPCFGVPDLNGCGRASLCKRGCKWRIRILKAREILVNVWKGSSWCNISSLEQGTAQLSRQLNSAWVPEPIWAEVLALGEPRWDQRQVLPPVHSLIPFCLVSLPSTSSPLRKILFVILFIILGVGRICLPSTSLAHFSCVSEWWSCSRVMFNDSVKSEVWHCAGSDSWQKVCPLVLLLLLHLFLLLSSGWNVPVLFMPWFYTLVKEEKYMCYVIVLACSSSDVILHMWKVFSTLLKKINKRKSKLDPYQSRGKSYQEDKMSS